MDIPLHYFDEYVGDRLYSYLDNPFARFAASSKLQLDVSSPDAVVASLASALGSIPALSSLGRDHVVRQSISLYGITYLGILVLYFSVATLSYYLIFDHRMKLHPRYLPDQVRKEIYFSLEAFPVLDLLTLPWFVGDVRGHSMLYDTIAEGPFGHQGGVMPWVYMAFSSALFLWFTDFAIYWVHRWLHIPFLYKRLHKPHHKWIIPTPFASHAFHPVDGYLQSVPYHMACYMFPIHKYLFIGLFSFVNFWSIFIHDSDMLCGHPLEHYINGPAHHTLHHIYFTCNYGQYFTWADKYFSSFRQPAKGDDPLIAVLAKIERQKMADLIQASLEDEKRQHAPIAAVGIEAAAVENAAEEEGDQVDAAQVAVVGRGSGSEEPELLDLPVHMSRSESASDSGIGSEPELDHDEKRRKARTSTSSLTTTTATTTTTRGVSTRSKSGGGAASSVPVSRSGSASGTESGSPAPPPPRPRREGLRARKSTAPQ